MKIEIENAEEVEKEITYPCLMEGLFGPKLLILFKDENSGICLQSPHNHQTMQSFSYLDASNYKPFKGKITLSND